MQQSPTQSGARLPADAHAPGRGPNGDGHGAPPGTRRLTSLLVEFDDPGALLTACERVRDSGFTQWDSHTPYPVHGIDRAMGIRPTRLPYLVFACGLAGCLTGVGMQWWMNASNPLDFKWVPTFLQGYQFIISGKPYFSLPANIPIIFELTVLFSAFGAFLGMLGRNGLPRLYQALFRSARFRRATNDRFFIRIDASDPRFDPVRTEQFAAGLGGTHVERIEDWGAPRLPGRVKVITALTACLALLPLALTARAWVTRSEQPRIHLVQDMDNQERYKAQQAHPLFADGRASRPVIAGTIAREDRRLLLDNPHFYEGRIGNDWAATFPPTDGTGQPLQVTEGFVRRGQARFNIYCAPCHGWAGHGDGPIHQRALLRLQANWVQPTSLHDETVRARPIGHIFNTITNGIRTMPPYGDQIPEIDRWAIVAYVRALERSQNAAPGEVPEEIRPELR